jgi:ribose/xylose/arabinose/galactoside ABC-type transport system permease subunit
VISRLTKGLNLLGLSFFDQAIVLGAIIVVGSAFQRLAAQALLLRTQRL